MTVIFEEFLIRAGAIDPLRLKMGRKKARFYKGTTPHKLFIVFISLFLLFFRIRKENNRFIWF